MWGVTRLCVGGRACYLYKCTKKTAGKGETPLDAF